MAARSLPKYFHYGTAETITEVDADRRYPVPLIGIGGPAIGTRYGLLLTDLAPLSPPGQIVRIVHGPSVPASLAYGVLRVLPGVDPISLDLHTWVWEAEPGSLIDLRGRIAGVGMWDPRVGWRLRGTL